MSESALHVKNIIKRYDTPSKQITILKDISFHILQGETVAIVGPSGSGKSTLLGLSAGLDQPSSGEVILRNKPIHQLSEDEKAELRNKDIGFVFQNFQLIPTLTALDNVMVPLDLQGVKDSKEKALKLIERVGLQERSNHYPSELSGGEQQRIAIARAFINQPKVLFADEPTGNLDDETSDKIEELLFGLNEEHNTTLIIVTHDLELAKKCQRVIRLKSGQIASDSFNDKLVSNE